MDAAALMGAKAGPPLNSRFLHFPDFCFTAAVKLIGFEFHFWVTLKLFFAAKRKN